MTFSPFEVVTQIVFPHEGGVFTDHGNDPGGPRRWGVTVAMLSHWRGVEASAADVRELTRNEAIVLLSEHYVDPYILLHNMLRSNVIDMAVSAGHDQAVAILQYVVGVKVSGRIDAETILATRQQNWNIVYSGARVAYYNDRSQAQWHEPWRRRALSFCRTTRIMTLKRYLHSQNQSEEAIFGFMGKAYK